MSSLSSSMKCYLVVRLLMGFVDFITDILQAASLFSLGHTWWGLLTLLFPLLAALMALLSVLISRCRRGWRSTEMGPFKTAVLTCKALATTCEGLFESGPELVLQSVILFHGVHLADFKILGDESMAGSSWAWWRAVLHMASIASSFVSLVVTIIYYNEEKCPSCRGNSKGGDGPRFCFCVLSTTLSISFRVFVSAVLFSVAPISATLLVISVYIVNLVTYGLTLPGGWGVAAVAAYASLYSPAGHAKNHGHHSSVIQTQQQQYKSGSLLRRQSQTGRTRAAVTLHESYSEVERAKINQESLVVRVRLSHILFVVTSLLAIVPYVTLLEVFLFADGNKREFAKRSTDGSDLVPALKSRAVLYSVPSVLLVLLIPLAWLFCRRVVMARDAARQWFAITPHRNRNPSTPARGGSSGERQASFTQRLRAEEEEAVSFHRDGSSSEASTVRVTDRGDGDNRPIIRPSAPPPSIPESLPPPYEPHYSEPKPALQQQQQLYPEIPEGNSATIVPTPTTPARRPPGTSKCSGSCVTCELFVEGSSFRSEMTGRSYRFVTPVSCRTASVVYLVSCNRCRKQYVGKTEQTLRQRHYGHRREIETASSPLGRHFAEECGYANWRMQIIDQCDLASGLRRREGYWMKELMTMQPWGLNSKVEAAADEKS